MSARRRRRRIDWRAAFELWRTGTRHDGRPFGIGDVARLLRVSPGRVSRRFRAFGLVLARGRPRRDARESVEAAP